ncbi:hypothetical protein P6144_08145 [Sphingomonas sp. HITSZ_GF]|uniref:hypothetical protein n=1 Tax=Sphingomonas sp. HITSZ_GF TaxID=3037247 RepID=UPI00240D6C11|nr:hypothetical protein [Sphingomonas sp. HITSZ_GF]MDG2533612.1 hypothetical protein [Sphingomonas sp. HITSZ_GF]
MTAAETALRDAIEACYRAFAEFPAPRTLVASPLRDAKAILRTLTAAPLRQLGEENIGPYAGWAMTTVGNTRDYCHFLPRIFELSIDHPHWPGAEPVIMANKLVMAGWRDWPAERRRAVIGFLYTAFVFTRTHHSDERNDASFWLAALVILGEPIAPLFESWRAEPSPYAALQIALVLQWEGKQLYRHGEVRGAFWEDVDIDARRMLAELLLSDETRALLETAMPRVAEEDRWLLDAALAELDRKS